MNESRNLYPHKDSETGKKACVYLLTVYLLRFDFLQFF